MYEYQVIIYQEHFVSAFLPGGGKVDPQRFSQFLNTHAAKGWRVTDVEKEDRRTLLFWKREAFVVVMEREKSGVAAGARPAIPAVTPR